MEVIHDLKGMETTDQNKIIAAAKFAINIQNAANSRAIVREFKNEYAPVLHKFYPRGVWLQHPITRLVFAKLEDLRAYQTKELHRQGKYLTGNPTHMESYSEWDRENDESIDPEREVYFYDDPSDLTIFQQIYKAVEQIAEYADA